VPRKERCCPASKEMRGWISGRSGACRVTTVGQGMVSPAPRPSLAPAWFSRLHTWEQRSKREPGGSGRPTRLVAKGVAHYDPHRRAWQIWYSIDDVHWEPRA
jgi:hypothetical protein